MPPAAKYSNNESVETFGDNSHETGGFPATLKTIDESVNSSKQHNTRNYRLMANRALDSSERSRSSSV